MIKTFYRPDSAMINMLINHVVGPDGVRVIDNHRFIATVAVTPATEAWAATHPGETVITNALFGGGPVMEIGVSLSQITYDDFKRMTHLNMGKPITRYMSTATAVPEGMVGVHFKVGLYTDGKSSYCWVVPQEYTPAERQYVDMLKGFDFFYQYSDDRRVYAAATARLKDIRARGVALGLTESRMSEIYEVLAEH